MHPAASPENLLSQPRHCTRHPFLKAEDDQLRLLVTKFGETNWKLIANFMVRRDARQCRERYHNYLSPLVRNIPWTAKEEALLIEKVNELGSRWAKIAPFFEGRSEVNIKNQWAAMTHRNARIEKCARQKHAAEDECAQQEYEKGEEEVGVDARFWTAFSADPSGEDGCFD
jgi:hypothetical protein